MREKKDRKMISLSIENSDLHRLDAVCKQMSMDYGFPVSRTMAINRLVKKYLVEEVGWNLCEIDQIHLPLDCEKPSNAAKQVV